MKKTGQLLQDLRIQKGFTLAEVSSALKINSKVLHALEIGDNSQLPKPAFVRGFIKSYALYLKADPEPVLREYQQEIGASLVVIEGESIQDLTPELGSSSDSTENKLSLDHKKGSNDTKVMTNSPSHKENKSVSPQEKNERVFSYSDFDAEEKQRGGWRVVIFGLIIIILTLVIYTAFRTIERYQREAIITAETERTLGELAASGVTLPTPSTPLPETASAESESMPPQQQPEAANNGSGSSVSQVDSKIESGDQQKNLQTEQSSQQKAVPEPSAQPAANEVSPPKVAENAQATPPPAETVPSNAPPVDAPKVTTIKKFREILIEALDDVRIEFEASGKKGVLNLKKDQIHILRVNRSAVLKLSDAGAANISVDGTDRGIAGEKGSPIVVRY